MVHAAAQLTNLMPLGRARRCRTKSKLPSHRPRMVVIGLGRMAAVRMGAQRCRLADGPELNEKDRS